MISSGNDETESQTFLFLSLSNQNFLTLVGLAAHVGVADPG